jgi:hypothetical protein
MITGSIELTDFFTKLPSMVNSFHHRVYNRTSMSKGKHLAQKLIDEGERTLNFMKPLQPDVWGKQVHGDHSNWNVRDLFEHLILSEESLRSLFRRIVEGGEGSPEDFNINAFNAERHGKLSGLSIDELFERYRYSRSRTAAFAEALSDEQLDINGRHPAMGMSRIEEMLKMIYLHNTMHIKEIKKTI